MNPKSTLGRMGLCRAGPIVDEGESVSLRGTLLNEQSSEDEPMSEGFTPTRYKWTVEGYHKLGDAGILTEDSRVELIEGEIVEMAPIHGPHMGTVNRLTKMLVLAVGDHGVVSVQTPV